MLAKRDGETLERNVSTRHAGIGISEAIDAVRRALNAALVGKEEVTELVLACLFSGGHLLIDDLPGLGKTTLAKALAHAVGGRFARVQCTPDLLPGDITGFNIFNQKSREFEFLAGPVFSDVLLADEINRATPRTQSALFEAMAERQVTIDGTSRELSSTFFVIATQNPVESGAHRPFVKATCQCNTISYAIWLQINRILQSVKRAPTDFSSHRCRAAPPVAQRARS
ncbi:MAG TPA: AAA family ATPase [Planctomycetaceae bacterium]|jgi:MoxR-like ATPase|nr:AAA family ATPase [Planctomycetaceae bacterium]